MSEIAKIYIILGMSSNNVIECLLIEGYNNNDSYYYIMENYMHFLDQYPFIHKTIVNLMNIYKNQYQIEPNIANFIDLVENSDELGKNFLKIIEYQAGSILNACSYYQKNKKTIGLKTITNNIHLNQPVTINMENINETTIINKVNIDSNQTQKNKLPIIKKNESKTMSLTKNNESLNINNQLIESKKKSVKPKISLGLKK